MSFFATIRLTFCAYLYIISYTTSISTSTINSTGEYYTFNNMMHLNIQCDHPQLCYLQCDFCDSFTFITNSTSTIINCSHCDDLTIYAEYTHNFTMHFTKSQNSQIHIQHANNVFITYFQIKTTTIYAQYAQTFTFQPQYDNKWNVFYLDYVSKYIHFECSNSESIHCDLSQSTINALHANYFSFILPTNISAYSSKNFIYCPSHGENICVLDGLFRNSMDIYIENNISALNITKPNKNYIKYNDISYNIYCNNDSFMSNRLRMVNDEIMFECDNQLSECCYEVFYSDRNDIICDSKDSVCIIYCNNNINGTNCKGSNIFPSNTTMFLQVICQESFCDETIINCPTNSYSVCDISISTSSNVKINYNTNNEFMRLYCYKYACKYLEVFIDSATAQSLYITNVTNVVDFQCDKYSCQNAIFKVNTQIDMFNITCLQFWSCYEVNIHAQLVENLIINCLDYRACSDMIVYGKSDKMNAIQLKCNNSGCDRMNIFSQIQYELDYISLELIGNDLSPELRISCLSDNQVDYYTPFYCDPFKHNWNEVIYCNDNDECIYNLNKKNKTIIYANNADLLYILCSNCSKINIFAMNAYEVNIECIGHCKDIILNGKNINVFNLQCYGLCKDLIFDLEFVQNISINVESMISSKIISIHNENAFDLVCNNKCHELNLFISSITIFSITCNGDNACQTMNIYSNCNNGYRLWNDIKNLKIISCDNTTYNKSKNNWNLFCLSSIISIPFDNRNRFNYGQYSQYVEYEYINILDAIYYKFNNLSNQQLVNYNSINGIIKFDPLSPQCIGNINISELHIFHQIVSILICIILLVIFCFWFIILIQNLILKYGFPKKYNFQTNIKPPSKYLLKFMYLNDIFIWIVQIYLLIICCNIYMQYNDHCTSIPFDTKTINICNLQSFCQIKNNHCIPDSFLYSYYIITLLALCFGFILQCFPFCKVACGVDINDIGYDIGLSSHCAVVMSVYPCCLNLNQYMNDNKQLPWNNIIQTDYLKRKFWSVSKLILGFYFIRYIIFFIGPFILYFNLYNEDDIDVNFKWYDIFPVLMVLILNEIIKLKYTKLLPYNEYKHLQYILDEYFGDAISSIIISFLDDQQLNMHMPSLTSLIHPASNRSIPIQDEEGNNVIDIEIDENHLLLLKTTN